MVVYLKPPWSWLRGLWLWLWSPFGGSPGMAQTPWWAKEGRWWWVHLRGIYLAAGGRQLPREWFKTRGEWKLRMPRRYHGGRGTHKSGTLTLSQRQPSTTTTTTSPSYSPPPSTLVPSFKPPGTKYQLFSQQSSSPSPTTSIQHWRKIIDLVPLDNSKTATFLTIILKLQTPSTLNVESLEPLELLRKVQWIQFSNSSIWFGHLMSLIEIF